MWIHEQKNWLCFTWDTVDHKSKLAVVRHRQGRLLEDDFVGFMNTSKYSKLAKRSNDTALRDIRELEERGVFIQNLGGGRNKI